MTRAIHSRVASHTHVHLNALCPWALPRPANFTRRCYRRETCLSCVHFCWLQTRKVRFCGRASCAAVRHDRMPVTSSNLSARIHASLCQSYHVDHLYAILRTWGTWTRSRKDAKMQADDPALIEAMRRLWVLACPCFRLRSQLLAVRHAWIHDGHEQKVETQGKCQPAMVQFGIYCCLSLSCNYPTKHGCSRVA